jgi:DNA topoisomerase-1
MRYVNTVKVIPNVWKNIQLFRNNKKPEDDLFDKIDAQALNDYLKSQMDGLTAKVFRTYNASTTLQQELKKFELAGHSLEEKVEKYDEANKQVAILCNHQKTVGKKFVENLTKK